MIILCLSVNRTFTFRRSFKKKIKCRTSFHSYIIHMKSQTSIIFHFWMQWWVKRWVLKPICCSKTKSQDSYRNHCKAGAVVLVLKHLPCMCYSRMNRGLMAGFPYGSQRQEQFLSAYPGVTPEYQRVWLKKQKNKYHWKWVGSIPRIFAWSNSRALIQKETPPNQSTIEHQPVPSF